jgi:hypothetical protein
MLRNGLERDAMALALQTAATLLMLLAAVAILFPNLVFTEATQTAARDSDRPATVQPVVDRLSPLAPRGQARKVSPPSQQGLPDFSDAAGGRRS